MKNNPPTPSQNKENSGQERDVVEKAMTGNREAFEELMEEYWDQYEDYFHKSLGGDEAQEKRAKELTHEFFAHVFENYKSFNVDAEGTFSGWLYQVAKNFSIEKFRDREKSAARKTVFNETEYSSNLRSPDEAAEESVLGDLITKAFREVPPAFREVVILRDIQGLEFDEIAELTELPLGTVKSRVNRGRTKLQYMLDDVYDSPSS